MKIIPASVAFMENGERLTRANGVMLLKFIERIGRTCYKSEDRITESSYKPFISNLLKRGHLSVIEHVSLTANIVCDRGVTHEIVRHRIGSYSQESTRYCNYAGGKYNSSITVIDPASAFGWDIKNNDEDRDKYSTWVQSCARSEAAYMTMISAGASPQEARSVLPNSLKTEIWVTYNLREWRHFFELRCAPAAHPQMQEVAKMLLEDAHACIPLIFDDIYDNVFCQQ